MAAQDMPAAEVDITEALVRELLEAQHPDLVSLPLRRVASGWDNELFRLGAELVVRLPRRQLAAELVEHEQRWLPLLAPRLPIPIPAPVRVGRPGLGYPWSWSVCPWFDGDVAADVGLADPRREARRLGEFLAALHLEAPADAPANPFRDNPVGELSERVGRNLATLSGAVDTSAIRSRWAELVESPEWARPPVWVHGDLHVANLLVDHGAIAAVVDFGDITAADPAVDLAVAWMLFDRDQRAVLRESAGEVDDATWRRGQAWALHFSLVYLAHSADNARMRRIGERLLAAALTGD